MQLTHTLSNGQTITLHIKKTAKKNIILRPNTPDSIRLSIPPYASTHELQTWLHANEPTLHRILSKAPAEITALPQALWHQGRLKPIHSTATDHISITDCITIPQSWTLTQARSALRNIFYQQAQTELLTRLDHHANTMQQFPDRSQLSKARRFWGICRHHSDKSTSIGLNWRLIGAPTAIIDYVCIHELCHLVHPNHSPAFWQLVHHHAPHTQAAKTWLHTHGKSLFLLD